MARGWKLSRQVQARYRPGARKLKSEVSFCVDHVIIIEWQENALRLFLQPGWNRVGLKLSSLDG